MARKKKPKLTAEEEQGIEASLDYLASILVEAYLDEKCREKDHTPKSCSECKRTHSLPY